MSENINLIAAAPDLLEAAKLVVFNWEHQFSHSIHPAIIEVSIEQLKQAIKKAEGENLDADR